MKLDDILNNELDETNLHEGEGWSIDSVDLWLEMDWTDANKNTQTLLIKVNGTEMRAALTNGAGIAASLGNIMFKHNGGTEANIKTLRTAIQKAVNATAEKSGHVRATEIVKAVNTTTGLTFNIDKEVSHISEGKRRRKKKSKARSVYGYGGWAASYTDSLNGVGDAMSGGGDSGGGGE